MTDLVLDLTSPGQCACGRGIHRSRDGARHDQCFDCRTRPALPVCACGHRITTGHDQCSRCRAKPPERPKCACGRSIYTDHDKCGECRHNTAKRCACRRRIYDGQPTCAVCRRQERQPEIV